MILPNIKLKMFNFLGYNSNSVFTALLRLISTSGCELGTYLHDTSLTVKLTVLSKFLITYKPLSISRS